MTDETRRRFKRWLWRPPRPHGEVRPDRNVSFLELFYDLVYVAVIAQAAHHLAEHVTVRGVAEFAVIFSPDLGRLGQRIALRRAPRPR